MSPELAPVADADFEAMLSLRVAARRGSRANDFYRRHGFRVVAEQDFDIEYRWEAA